MVGRLCTVCQHPDRVDIDRALVAGEPPAAISKQFDIGKQAVLRHRAAHVPSAAMQDGAQAVVAAEAAHGAGLLQGATSLRDKALELLRKAEDAGDLRTALAGVREACRCLELMAKLAGEIDEGATVNLFVNPAWLAVQARILGALDGHPEVRWRVVQALEGVAC